MGGNVSKPVVQELLRDLAAAGIELKAAGDRIRYRPLPAMTPELAERIRQHRGELLAALNGVAQGPAVEATASTAVARSFNFEQGQMKFGDICFGWTPRAWMIELRRKAQCCRELRPDLADYYERWAADIESRLER
jgi:hypothetical protein